MGVKLWLHDNESWDEIMFNHVPPHKEYGHRQESNGDEVRGRNLFSHLETRTNVPYAKGRDHPHAYHSSLPLAAPEGHNPHALQKGHPHHTCLLEYSSTLYAWLRIAIHYTRVKIARLLLYSIDTLESTIIYHHLPHK